MKRLQFLVVLLTLALVTSLSGQALTDTDREKLLEHLDITSMNFQNAVAGLSEELWNYRAAEGRWTIAEVAEHIAASESLIREMSRGAMATPASAEMLKEARKDDVILARIPDRSSRFQAPEPLKPENRYKTPAGTMEAFRTERAISMKMAREGGDLRAYAAANPVLGPTDVYGWMLFMSAHVERHTKQIEEVKADPGFPRT